MYDKRLYRVIGANPASNQCAVSASVPSVTALRDVGIASLDLNEVTSIHYYFDGADEKDAPFAMTKRGGAALAHEKNHRKRAG